MIVEVNISPRGVRLLKTLGFLTGKSSDDLTQEVGDILEEALKKRVATELEIEVEASKPVQTPAFRRPFVGGVSGANDVTQIASGLGDDDLDDLEPAEIPPTRDPEGLIPKSGGLTEATLNQDMSIDDPSTEAKGEAPDTGIAQGSEIEEAFANMIGPNSWAEKRKKGPSKSRGRVTPLGGNDRL